MATVVIANQAQPSVQINESDNSINILNNQPVIEVVSQGVQGIPGLGVPAGGTTGQALIKKTDTNYDTEWATIGNNVTAVAGQTISALKIVYTDPATSKILYADKDTPITVNSLFGVTTQSGILNDEINVVTFGVIEDSSWAWNMAGNINLFLGSNGSIVQGAPVGNIVVKIGYAISAISIMVRVGEPVLTA